MARKYDYYRIIQQDYGQGYEDVSHYEAVDSRFNLDKETRSLLKHDLAEYRLLMYPTRVISRKELKEAVKA